MSTQNTIFAPQIRRPPPKVRGWPYVGSLPQLWRRHLDFLQSMQQKHGDIYTLDFGPTPVTILCHPEQAQYVLQTNANNYQEKGGNKGFRVAPYPLMSKGLAMVAPDNQAWHRQRRIVQPYFHHKHLPDMIALMIGAIDESLEDWQTLIESEQAINIEPALMRMAMNVIGRTMFGVQINPSDADAISEAVRCVMDYTWQGTLETMLPDWGVASLPSHQRYQEAIEQVYSLIDKLISRALETPEQRHLIGQLWQTIQEQEALTGQGETEAARSYLQSEAITTLITGYESTAANLAWAFHLLIQHPDKFNLLGREIRTVLGTRTPTAADVPKLTYTRMVIQEALRLYPPGYWTQRVAAEDDEIDGYFIAAGTIVTPIFYLIHRHPDIWAEPEQFQPERFTAEQVQQRHKLAWIPFGAGQRMCLAVEFSMIKEQLILAQILQKYELRAAPEQTANHKIVGTNVRPKAGVWATLSSR